MYVRVPQSNSSIHNDHAYNTHLHGPNFNYREEVQSLNFPFLKSREVIGIHLLYLSFDEEGEEQIAASEHIRRSEDARKI